jgi:hypothetical protein
MLHVNPLLLLWHTCASATAAAAVASAVVDVNIAAIALDDVMQLQLVIAVGNAGFLQDSIWLRFHHAAGVYVCLAISSAADRES